MLLSPERGNATLGPREVRSFFIDAGQIAGEALRAQTDTAVDVG